MPLLFLCPPLLASAGLVPAMLSFWFCSFWVLLLFMVLSFRPGHMFPWICPEPEVTVSLMFKLSHGFCNTCGEKNQQPTLVWLFLAALSLQTRLLSVPSLLPCWGQEQPENAGQLLAFPLPQLCQAVNSMVLVLLARERPGAWDLSLCHARTPLILVTWGTHSVAGSPWALLDPCDPDGKIHCEPLPFEQGRNSS